MHSKYTFNIYTASKSKNQYLNEPCQIPKLIERENKFLNIPLEDQPQTKVNQGQQLRLLL